MERVSSVFVGHSFISLFEVCVLSIFVFSLIGVVLSLRVLEFIVYRSVPDLLSDILLRFL